MYSAFSAALYWHALYWARALLALSAFTSGLCMYCFMYSAIFAFLQRDAATAGSEPWKSTTQSVVGVLRGSSQLSFKSCDTRKLAKSSGDPATAGFGDAATAGSEPWESPAIEATP